MIKFGRETTQILKGIALILMIIHYTKHLVFSSSFNCFFYTFFMTFVFTYAISWVIKKLLTPIMNKII